MGFLTHKFGMEVTFLQKYLCRQLELFAPNHFASSKDPTFWIEDPIGVIDESSYEELTQALLHSELEQKFVLINLRFFLC